MFGMSQKDILPQPSVRGTVQKACWENEIFGCENLARPAFVPATEFGHDDKVAVEALDNENRSTCAPTTFDLDTSQLLCSGLVATKS